MVIEIKVTLFFSWRCWKPLIFTLEFWKARSQQIELHGAVHIDTHQFTRPIPRSEEHTSELQSQSNLVCRLLLEKKKRTILLYQRVENGHQDNNDRRVSLYRF